MPRPKTTLAINVNHVITRGRVGEGAWAHAIALSFIMQKLK